jgi:hypothetical protein
MVDVESLMDTAIAKGALQGRGLKSGLCQLRFNQQIFEGHVDLGLICIYVTRALIYDGNSWFETEFGLCFS